jgi:hypothetical protein
MSRLPALFVLVALTAACSGGTNSESAPSTGAPANGAVPAPPPGLDELAPIQQPDRAPVPERRNGLNLDPPVPVAAAFPEMEALRATYLIPENPSTAEQSVREAAFAFGAMLVSAFQEPAPSASNTVLPGLATPLPLPASLNMLGRATLYRRTGATGVDVGPSRPDREGRIWVAVYQGAAGPIGRVEAFCSGVTVRADGTRVVVEVVDMPASLLRQPKDRKDFPVVLCEVDLESPPDEGFQPAA